MSWRRRFRKRKARRQSGQLPAPLRWRPRVRIFGLLTGAIGGLGTVILMQQYGISVLTRALTLQGLIGGAMSGIIVPSVVFAAVVTVHNKRLARAHGRLAGATGARLAVWIFFAMLALPLLVAGQARADMTGPCTTLINGQDVRDLPATAEAAIQLQSEGTLEVFIVAPSDIFSLYLGVRWAGLEYTFGGVDDDPSEDEGGGSGGGAVAVGDVAWLGGGLYEVFADVEMLNGDTCSMDVVLNVDQDPLETLAGVAAAGATSIGAIGLVGVSVSSLLEGRAYLSDLASVVVDINKDGIADATAFDTDADGVIDTLGMDTTGDGKIDQIVVDTDHDGVFDTAYSEAGQLEVPEAPAPPPPDTPEVRTMAGYPEEGWDPPDPPEMRTMAGYPEEGWDPPETPEMRTMAGGSEEGWDPPETPEMRTMAVGEEGIDQLPPSESPPMRTMAGWPEEGWDPPDPPPPSEPAGDAGD